MITDLFKMAFAKLPILGRILRQRDEWARRHGEALRELDKMRKQSPFPPGHFYSPIPSLEEVQRHFAVSLNEKDTIPGVEMNDDGQLKLLELLSKHYVDCPYVTDQKGPRYYFDQSYFRYMDALVLYAMILNLRPRHIIEVGSGFSSAVMLDAIDSDSEANTKVTFIEPYPDRLKSLLRPGDQQRARLIEQPLQEVGLELFAELSSGDVLFIDSSHVVKCGSDVNYLLLDVLPSLQAGVWVHFHDIFWPFEYPMDWLLEGRAWNEAYMVRSFLQYNSRFQIRLFNSFLGARHQDELARLFPLGVKDTGGSLWLQKV